MSDKPEFKYRAFISYSHDDLGIVRKLAEHLRETGVFPMWDQNFVYGCGFHEQIKTFIAHAHVFVPVITSTSVSRGWVQQEIGYAMALGIPVIPIAVDRLPGEMLQQLHAIQLEPEKEDEILIEKLKIGVFDNLVGRYRDPSLALHRCAEYPEDRSMMMAEYAQSILDLGQSGNVRQLGGLSSFHIPDKLENDEDWTTRYLNQTRSLHHRRLLRQERITLGEHAKRSGCKIIVNPDIPYDDFIREARIVRLQYLRNFLNDDKTYPEVLVAFDQAMIAPMSQTLVGDWFYAESIAAPTGQGYIQTIFTRHAPSMLKRQELFDERFDSLLHKARWTPTDCRKQAVSELDNLIQKL